MQVKSAGSFVAVTAAASRSLMAAATPRSFFVVAGSLVVVHKIPAASHHTCLASFDYYLKLMVSTSLNLVCCPFLI